MDSLAVIIKKIETQKKEANRFPSFAMKNEIWSELFMQMETELELMVYDKHLVKMRTVNGEAYETNKI